MNESPVERLTKTNPDLEVWWDSSPLVYAQWTSSMLASVPASDRAALDEQLSRLFSPQAAATAVFRGCTTNPPLSWKAVQADRPVWDDWIDGLLLARPDAEQSEIFWLTYKEVVRRGAEMFLPLYDASAGRYGWISGQLDPRCATDVQAMIRQGKELSALSPNVMVKVPATMEGLQALLALTMAGVSTNVTVCFTLPQVMSAARTVWEGTQAARRDGGDLSRWRSVITLMIGRLTENEALDVQAQRRGLSLSRVDKHWFGLAVFKRAVRLLWENGWPSKMLACSMRAGPLIAGKEHFWDIEMLAGGDIVFTMPPYVLEPLFRIGDGLRFDPDAIHQEIPPEVMDRLLEIPYVIQAFDPNGLANEQFNDHPATIDTLRAFSRGSQGLEAYVAERMSWSTKLMEA
jgi:transaldolase